MTRVLYVGSSFCRAWGMAGDLPRYLREAGVEVDVVVPRTSGIDEGDGLLAERLVSLSAYVDGVECRMRMFEGRRLGIRTFYVDGPELGGTVPALACDTCIRAAAVYAHAVVQWLANSPVIYDVVHCEGLAASLVAVLMRTSYSNIDRLAGIRSVVSLPGIEDKGELELGWAKRLGFPDGMCDSDHMEFYGKLSILKGVYLYADAILLPDDGVMRRIEKNRGRDIGMEGVLFGRVGKLHAVRFGIDLEAFDPSSDKCLAASYGAADLSGKARCKSEFTQKYRLKKDSPVVAFLGRLDGESGIDLVNDILDDLMDNKVSLVVVGRGSKAYRDAVDSWRQEFRGRVVFIEDCPSKVASEIYSAADIVLLPGKRETLGRRHLEAMRYGAVPVVLGHGCAASDVIGVRDIDAVASGENGFVFSSYDGDEFFDAVMDALDVYETSAFASVREAAIGSVSGLDVTATGCAGVYASLLQ